MHAELAGAFARLVHLDDHDLERVEDELVDLMVGVAFPRPSGGHVPTFSRSKGASSERDRT